MALTHQPIGHRIERHGVVMSTNDLAWDRLADPTNHGMVILAEEQMQGRGRRGGSWQAPAGSSLLLSIPLLPPHTLRRPSVLTLWASLGVCRVIDQSLHLPVTWKWPNDVLVHGQKVCGTLVEQRGEAFVVGLGLNVSASPAYFESVNLTTAAALSHFTSAPLDREVLLTSLLAVLDESYRRLALGNMQQLLADWHQYSRLLHQYVELDAAGVTYSGRVTALTGEAITLDLDGRIISLVPETITALRARVS
jgi:BirA family biotin operon repressor/biotin-[acetyl-CoA-carboxylase] ligase